jgi:putative SOS response-associated peptidase YedK
VSSLYRLDCTAADIAQRFSARLGDDPWAGGYVAPMKFAPVVTAGREFVAGPRPAGGRLEPRITPRLWGVLPPPNSSMPDRRIMTVRNPDSPFWIGSLRNSEFRCIVPATAFMAWSIHTDYEGRRLKHWFAPESPTGHERIFAIAGVWKDEDVPAFAVLTRDASAPLRAAGCANMPVILPDLEEARQIWLHGSWSEASRIAQGTPPALAQMFPALE